MITDKNEDFLARFGSPETTKKIWEMGEPMAKLAKTHYHEENFKQNPFTHTDAIAHIATHYNEDEFAGHPNLPREMYDKAVRESSGYRRDFLLKSPHLTLDHIKTMEKKKPFFGNEYAYLGRTQTTSDDILDHLTQPEKLYDASHESKLESHDIFYFSKNKNLKPRHLSSLIDLGTSLNKNFNSSSITFQNIAKHPNLSKENAEELRTKVKHPYINELLDKRGM